MLVIFFVTENGNASLLTVFAIAGLNMCAPLVSSDLMGCKKNGQYNYTGFAKEKDVGGTLFFL